MITNNIVGRRQTGKLMVSPEKTLPIEKQIAYHLGTPSREFQSGILDENTVENVDETHFVINMDNGKTLGFRGDDNVKYADVVSAGVGMTMVVRLTGGPHATICPPFMIFQNDNCSYPIRGVPDDVPGVSYRTAKKGFMTREVWLQWLQERRAQATIRSQRRVVFVDNVSSHDLSEKSAFQVECFLQVLGCKCKIQPCDSYVISKIKDSWMAHWESYKLDAIKKGMWQDVSGAIKNLGKHFFLKLAATAVQEVNSCRVARV